MSESESVVLFSSLQEKEKFCQPNVKKKRITYFIVSKLKCNIISEKLEHNSV